jgi:predicted CXXCH cytochrome family protein
VVKVSNPESPVAVLRIADTCARCHGDSDLMEEFDHYENAPEDWKTSEHAKALLEGGDLSAPTCPTCHGSHNATRPESLEDLLGACANCHVREADLYQKSSHKVALDDVEESGCITCHSNHAVEEPTEAMLGLEEGSVCYDCHNEQMAGVEMIRQSKVRLVELADSIEQAEQALDRAHVAGMLVDEGMLILGRAREQQILSKVAMHGFELDPIVERVDAGLALSAEAEQYGDDAMVELQYRRKGLAVATLLILGFLITLGVKIRRLPSFPD